MKWMRGACFGPVDRLMFRCVIDAAHVLLWTDCGAHERRQGATASLARGVPRCSVPERLYYKSISNISVMPTGIVTVIAPLLNSGFKEPCSTLRTDFTSLMLLTVTVNCSMGLPV